MFLIVPLLGAIATGVGAVGGLIQGAKRGRAADRLNRRAVEMAERDYAGRGFARDRFRSLAEGGGPENEARDFRFSDRLGRAGDRTEAAMERVAGFRGAPAFRAIGPGQASDFSGIRRFLGSTAPGVDPTDTTGVRGQLAGARSDVDAARIAPLGPIGTGAYGEGRDLTRMGLGEIRRVDLPGDYGRVEGGVGPEAGRARELASGALEGVVGGQGRGEIADSRFRNLLEQAEDAERLGTQGIARDAARLGRLGSGMVTTSLGDLRERTQRTLAQQARGLAADTAEGEIGDRRSALSAALGAGGQFRAEDRDLRDESRFERAFERGTDSERAQLALARAGATRGVAGDLIDIAGRERGERADDRDFGFRQGVTGADLALRRGSARAGLAGQEEGILRRDRGERVGERDFLRGDEFRRAGMGMDLGQIEFGQGQALRGEARGERDAGRRAAFDDLSADQSVLGQIAGLEGNLYGREANEREFLNRLFMQDAGNRFTEMGQLGAIGFTPPPVGGLIQGAAAQAQAGAGATSGAANLLQSYLQWRQMQQQGGGAPSTITPVGQTYSLPAHG